MATTLLVNGNLVYDYVNLNVSTQLIIYPSRVPTAGTLDIVDGSTVLLTLKAADNTLALTSRATLMLDSGEHSLAAVLRDGNGVELERSSIVRIGVPPGGVFGPRFGLHAKVTSLADYNAAFFKSLTTRLTDSGEQFITCPTDQSTSDNNKFFYVAWPKSLGYGYFRDFTSGKYGFSGSWDGAEEFDDFNFVGPAEVSIEGTTYYIYRNDFAFDSVNYVFSIVYGSSVPESGQP